MLLSENCDVLYVSELNCAFVKWKRYCEHDAYRRPLLHAVEIINSHDGCSYIADMRDAFEPCTDDDTWLHEEFSQMIADCGCKHIFYIKNKESLLDNMLENRSALLQRHFSVHFCENFDDIKLIILSQTI